MQDAEDLVEPPLGVAANVDPKSGRQWGIFRNGPHRCAPSIRPGCLSASLRNAGTVRARSTWHSPVPYAHAPRAWPRSGGRKQCASSFRSRSPLTSRTNVHVIAVELPRIALGPELNVEKARSAER